MKIDLVGSREVVKVVDGIRSWICVSGEIGKVVIGVLVCI